MTGRYFEEFTVGSEIVSAGQTLTLESMIAFATLYDPQNFHIDVEAAKSSPYGGLIADAAYERAVNLTASLGWHFSTQGAEVSFVIAGQGRGTDLHEFLARLAVINPQRNFRDGSSSRSNR